MQALALLSNLEAKDQQIPDRRDGRGPWGVADLRRDGNTVMVVPRGVLGPDMVAGLRPVVRQRIDPGTRHVVFDLRQTRHRGAP